MSGEEYYRPKSMRELSAVLERSGGRIAAGCTDMLPRIRRGLLAAVCVVDISGVEELRFIRETEGGIAIGALVTHAEMAASPLLKELALSLAQAAASVGCQQTRNRGTLGGNLANASPAADSAPPLLALDAMVHLVRSKSRRSMPLAEFFRAPGQTALTQGELIESVSFIRPAGRHGSAFFKLGRRSAMAISVVNAAASIVLDAAGKVLAARVALGAVAPVPVRCAHSEECLVGSTPGAERAELFRAAGQAAVQDISPIDDVRATGVYRVHAAAIAVQRVLEEAWQQAKGKSS